MFAKNTDLATLYHSRAACPREGAEREREWRLSTAPSRLKGNDLPSDRIGNLQYPDTVMKRKPPIGGRSRIEEKHAVSHAVDGRVGMPINQAVYGAEKPQEPFLQAR